MKKSILVIGLGRFGRQLAVSLSEQGIDVCAVDSDMYNVQLIQKKVTKAIRYDCTDESDFKALAADSYDCCFVCMGENFPASLEIISLLKEYGAKKVVAKTDGDRHTKLLMKVGADAVVFPEREVAQNIAVQYSTANTFDYVELSPEYSLFEIAVPRGWIGRSPADMKLRDKYNVNVIGVKDDDKVTTVTRPDYTFREGQHIILAGETNDIKKLAEKV